MARPTILQSLFGRARRSAAVPVAEVAADRQAAGVELLAAQRAVEAAETAYSAGLLDLSADLPALDEARRTAARKLDQAKALMRAFEDQHVAAQAAERQVELARIVAEADAKVAEFRQAVENDLPLLGVAARGILRLWAEAELAQETANRAIAAAEAGEPRPPVEAFRASAGRAERTLRSERVELWVDERGEPAGAQDAIVRQSDGSGYLRLPSATHGRTFRHKRAFERKEVLAAESVHAPAMLAASMMIPGIMIGDQPAWVPLSDPTPSKVLAQLDRLERSIEPEGDTRQPRTLIRHLPGEEGRVVEVAKPAHVPTFRAS